MCTLLSGITEFATLTTAALIAMRRTRTKGRVEARIYSGLVKALAIGYPFLGLAYLTDRMGTLVEPVFFVAFSVMMLAERVRADRTKGRSAPTWSDRLTCRRLDVRRQWRAAYACPAPGPSDRRSVGRRALGVGGYRDA